MPRPVTVSSCKSEIANRRLGGLFGTSCWLLLLLPARERVAGQNPGHMVCDVLIPGVDRDRSEVAVTLQITCFPLAQRPLGLACCPSLV